MGCSLAGMLLNSWIVWGNNRHFNIFGRTDWNNYEWQNEGATYEIRIVTAHCYTSTHMPATMHMMIYSFPVCLTSYCGWMHRWGLSWRSLHHLQSFFN
jgi:hypothetical protein